jgi:cytochrome c peroxidase
MEGTTGARNAPTIQNVAWDHFFFWDARALTIELQAFEPVRGHAEMHSSWPEVYARLQRDARYPPLFKAAFGDPGIDSMRIAFAIAQFERTLVSLNAKYDRVLHGKEQFTNEEQRGRDLFFGSAHCVDCHEPPLFRSHAVANIGLDSLPADPGMGGRTHIAWHMGRFKTPTLRNVAVSAPYMHDGRFQTLEQVLDFYADDVQVNTPTLDAHMQPWVNGEVRLSAQDRSDLVAFLKALTDEEFLVDERHAAPR